jgi:hypothetical protein
LPIGAEPDDPAVLGPGPPDEPPAPLEPLSVIVALQAPVTTSEASVANLRKVGVMLKVFAPKGDDDTLNSRLVEV